MMDPFGSMKNMLGQMRQFAGNPMQYMMQKKLNIPQEYMNDPNAAIQHLMNTGVMSQDQYSQLQNMAKQIQQNPQFQQFINQQ